MNFTDIVYIKNRAGNIILSGTVRRVIVIIIYQENLYVEIFFT